MNPQQLREKRAQLAALIRQLADKVNGETPREFTAEEKTQWEKVNSEYNQVVRSLEISERAAQVDADLKTRAGDPDVGKEPYDGKDAQKKQKRDGKDRPEVTEEHRTLALQAWMRHQAGFPLKKRHREACRLLRLRPNARRLDIPLYDTRNIKALQRQFRSGHPETAVERLREFRAMSGQSAGAGGYLIPPETLLRSLEINMLYFGGMRQVAETITTDTGERISWPTADDTSNVGEQLGESASVDNSGAGGPNPTLAKLYWDAYKFSSKMILVPHELLEDEVFDLPELIGEMLGERLGRITNTRYTTGTGASQPRGIITAAVLGVTAASTSAIAADEIIKLEHSIDPAYRQGASYMLHDSILLNLRLLKDGQGRYLWQSGFNDGTPDKLNSRPLTVNQDMASSSTSGAKTLLFGQLNKYKIRRVKGLRFYRLQERYRDKDQDGFIGFIREDGGLLNAGTAPVKYLQH